MTETQKIVEQENQHHRYLGSEIPWYVHVLWVGFWTLCIWYLWKWAVPAIQSELLAPR